MKQQELHLNENLPMIMHIDLNSCFAIIEQQANRLLRGRPVGVAAYDTPRGFVLAASYEAKAKGIKLGVNVEQARSLCPGIVIMTPDPAKYREAHRLFKAILLEYSPVVVPKSIDEFILDLDHSPSLKKIKSQIRNSKQFLNNKPKTMNIDVQNSKFEARELDSTERHIHNQAMLHIGKDIKKRISESLGEWVTVNIGISTNRFLAKYAAGFDKPDGMTLIDHTNVEKWLRCGTVQAPGLYSEEPHDCRSKNQNCKLMTLVDLPGINTRYRSRLRQAGIYTPLDFLDADAQILRRQVFKSINGLHWYNRLRGYEVDNIEFSQKSIGHQHALSDKTTDMEKLERLLMKLCEKTGRRLRKNNYYATGIHLYLGFVSDQPILDGPAAFDNMQNIHSWHHGEKVLHRLYATADIYESAKKLLYQAEIANRVKIMSVHVFGLEPWDPEQLSLFAAAENCKGQQVDYSSRAIDAGKRLSDAVDEINNRYDEFVVTSGTMIDMNGTILDRIAFGQVRDL